MQLVAVPTSQWWPCCFWIEYQPRLFRRFAAPVDDERRTLGASIAAKEAQIKRWIDHVCSKHHRTLQLMAVRTIERGPGSHVREGRLSSADAYEVFARIADYAGCPIVPCTLINMRNAEVDLIMKARYWDKLGKTNQPLCRLGIHMGLHSPNPGEALQCVTRDNQALAIMKMNTLYGRIQQMIDEGKPFDDETIDELFAISVSLSLDTDIARVIAFNERQRLIRLLLQIANQGSLHIERKKSKRIEELNELLKKRT